MKQPQKVKNKGHRANTAPYDVACRPKYAFLVKIILEMRNHIYNYYETIHVQQITVIIFNIIYNNIFIFYETESIISWNENRGVSTFLISLGYHQDTKMLNNNKTHV